MSQKEVFNQDCPLCGAPADYCWVDYGNRKYFDCPNCTLFQISRRAEKIVLDAPTERRSNFAKQAMAAPKEYALLIRIPSPPREADSTVSGEYVLRSELPQ